MQSTPGTHPGPRLRIGIAGAGLLGRLLAWTLAHQGQLHAWRHSGFWQPMDTLRDKHVLEELWASGQAPWKKW